MPPPHEPLHAIRYDVAAQIPSRGWDALVAGRPFSGVRWLSFVEAAFPALRPHYLILHDAERPVAALACVERPHEDIPVRQPMRAMLDRYLRRRPLLSCQVYLFSRPAFAIAPDADQPGAAKELAAASLALARELGASFLVYDFLQEGADATLLAQAGLSVVRYPGGGATRLDITWRSLDEYLAALPTRTRKDIARGMRLADHAGIRASATTDLAPWHDEMSRLFANVSQRHPSAELDPAPSLCSLAGQHLGNDARLLLAHSGDALAGCGFIFRDGGHAALRLLGLDYALNEHGQVYRALSLEAIRQAIAMGAQTLDGGSTAYEWKSRLGFVEEPTSVAFASPSRLLDALGRLASRALA